MMRRMLSVLSVAAIAAGLFATPTEAATTTPVPFPAHPKGLVAPVALPAELDPVPAYQPQVSCSPVDMIGPTKLRALVLATYKIGRKGNISRGCTEGLSEHSEGRAWDWMLDDSNAKEKAAAGDFLAWVTANHGENARRLGIMYVIHNKKIWGAYREQDGWRPSYDHTDHIHISFSWNGARANTSFWTGTVQPVDRGRCPVFVGQPAPLASTPQLTACPPPVAPVKTSSYAPRMYGSRSSSVSTAQGLLKITRTGVFDAKTWTAVKALQTRHGLPWTGQLDKVTWACLKPSTATGDVGAGFTKQSAAAYGLANYSGSTISRGAAGKPVEILQIALGMGVADRSGYFVTPTKSAVIAFQTAHGLEPTGAVTNLEWKALAGS